MRTKAGQEWRERYRKYAADYADLLTWDPFEDWERNREPENSVEDELQCALELLYAGETLGARSFLERGRAVIERIEAEDRLTRPAHPEAFPLNRAEFLRAKAYTEGLWGGAGLDRADLSQAIDDLQTWLKGEQGEWSTQSQSFLHSAVRMALILDEPARARKLLASRRRPDGHGEELGLLRRLAQDGPEANDGTLRDEFDRFFDPIRSPSYQHVEGESFDVPNGRLELALVRDVRLVSPDGSLDWARVIRSVGDG
ncbi:MAG: hypothetical protein MJE66_13140 [Proteobacteria bacterium]|nr:hypothetical protein [Pseudomonadota bacterium]